MLPPDILDVVFSWSLDDIFNQDLYKDKVEEIPETFDSVNHYRQSFIFPLLEEIRQDLSSKLELISDAPYSELVSCVAKPAGPFGKEFYDVKAKCWSNVSSSDSLEIYKPGNGDVFVLTDVVPESLSDLDRYGRTYILASITRVEDGGESTTDFKIKASKTIGDVDGMEKSLFATFLLNSTTYSRIWRALGLGGSKMGNEKIIETILCRNSLVPEKCDSCNSGNTTFVAPQIFSDLNDSQIGAVTGSLSEIQCSHKCSVKLICGPPGTGKTKTICELLWLLLSMNHNILICGPTNVSILQVSSCLLKLVKNRHPGSVNEPICYRLSDIVLYGNKNRLKISPDDDLCDIYLDYRVNRLAECFHPLTGWKHQTSSFIDFLENCSSQYHIHVENERNFKDDGADTGDEENVSTPDQGFGSFLEFFKNRVHAQASSLTDCIYNLCTYLPVSLLSASKFDCMIELLILLEYFEKILPEIDADDKDMEKIFGLSSEDFDAEDFCLNRNESSNLHMILAATRIRCLCLLTSLKDTLEIPCFYDKTRIRDFCLQSALLVLCTASTSCKLVGIKSFDSLVIDEASQLKECESAIPIQHVGIRHVILIGDENQLPATVQSKFSEEAKFGRSMFERLSSVGCSKHLLKVQYRMHPSISLFPNKKFYGGQILNGPNVTSKDYEKCYLPGKMYRSYSFINVVDGREEFDEAGHSKKNLVEVAVVLQVVHNLYKARSGKQEKISIGIISPYAAQVASIKEKLGKSYDISDDFSVKVRSIDGFQGGEEDVIIISTVRSNSDGSIGFLSSPQRTNVALTRARHCLWVLGNGATLMRSGSVWEAFICDAEARHCFFNADDDEHLSKAILNAKKELNLFDDLLDKDSILFRNENGSDNFKRSFAKIKSSWTKKAVLNLLLKLSGGWRPKKCNADVVNESSVHLVKQYKVQSLYVICNVDIMKYSVYTQVLKIWDVIPLTEIESLVQRLDVIFATYTDDYINHCKMKCFEGKLVIPMHWNKGVEIVQYRCFDKKYAAEDSGNSEIQSFDCKSYAENSKVSESLLLMKFYSLSSGIVGHLLSAGDGRELELPFEVSDHEREIIMFAKSAFILGRSGTGKTTILTMKLVQREQQCHLSSKGLFESKYISLLHNNVGINSDKIIRQLFVTVSSKLSLAIKNHVDCLKSFTCGGNYPTHSSSLEMHDSADSSNEFADLPDCFDKIEPSQYPLIITFQKFMMILDGSVGHSFFNRFNDLNDLHLNEGEFGRSPLFHAFVHQREVTYDRFASVYWPHFNNRLIRRLDSSTVFKEIISSIKGGISVSSDGVLSRADYIKLSESRSSTISSENRSVIFDIFLDYENKKISNGDFDLCDFVIDLHRRLKTNGGYHGDKVDFVYVDEVQDLTMRQITLFKYVCRNFNEGFVFAGDTAQTIARGIDFRFQEIRSLFYTEFLLEQKNCNVSHEKDKELCMSDLFQLNRNFRTHAGILKLAQSVINLVQIFFPQSLDRLSPETCLIYGEAPVVLESNDENAIVTIFGSCGSNIADNYNGFGAEQVILVRDDASKEEISRHIGRQALVLTILECKGLEFQDVLLFNFFGSSPLKNQWRVIYWYMQSQNLLNPGSSHSFPCFDFARHGVLCSELKQLYVAITRTRQRLWICETMEIYAQPMFEYWKKLCLVQARKLDGSLAQAMRVASSKDEWRGQGIKLFREGNYEMATLCFERAGDVFRERWARAAGLRASGISMLHSNLEMARNALTEAAGIYEAIGKAEAAAKCYVELSEFKKAGMIYLEKCGESNLEDAGDCFFKARCWFQAAEAYSKRNNISRCLLACSKGKLFDKGLSFINCWKNDAAFHSDTENAQRSHEIMNSFLEVCALHYHGLNDKKNMTRFVKLFSSVELMRNFLKPKNYLDELLLLEDELGNFMEAAEIAKLKGDLLLESSMLEKANKFEESAKVLLFHITMHSLWPSGGKGWPLRSFLDRDLLLNRAKSIAEKCSSYIYKSVCVETNIISDTLPNLRDLVNYLDCATKLKNFRAEYFSVRKILDVYLQVEPSNFQWEETAAFKQLEYKDMMLCCNMSSSSMMYFWNIWKDKVSSVSAYLESSSENDYMVYENFCLEYFGVRKENPQKYIVLNCGTSWLKELDCRSLCRTRDLIYVHASQFLSAAKKYWDLELFNVGTKVLERLDALRMFSRKKSLFHECLLLVDMFVVSKYLKDLKLLSPKINVEAPKKFLTTSKQRIFEIIFHFDWKNSLTRNIICLRECFSVRQMLRELLLENISSGNDKLSYGQMGRLAILLFGIDILDEEIFLMIRDKLGSNCLWKTFINHFKTHEASGSQHINLILSLTCALKGTFDVNWKIEVDYISPHCFIYLIERLLFFSSSCAGYFFTTKAYLLEALATGRRWTKFSGSKQSLSHIVKQSFDFIAYVVQQLFSCKDETVNWMRKSNVTGSEPFQLVVLRLVIIISLVYVNSGLHFTFLKNILRKDYIVSQIPKPLFESLIAARADNFLDCLATALLKIGDLLVNMQLENDRSVMQKSNILVVNVERMKERKEMFDVLFPDNIETSPGDQAGNKHVNPVNVLPGARTVEDVHRLDSHPTVMQRETSVGAETSSRSEKLDSPNSCSRFWSALEFLQSECIKCRDPRNISLIALQQKKVKESVEILNAVLNHFDQKTMEDDLKELIDEFKMMLDKLNQLSHDFEKLADNDNSQRNKEISGIEDLFQRLFGRKAKLQSLFDTVIPENDLKDPEKKVAGDAELQIQDRGKKKSNKSSNCRKKKGKGKKK